MNIMKTSGSPSAETAETSGETTRVLLVTGLSGAGKSTALKAIEDLGYDAVDNLPLPLLPTLFQSPDNYSRTGSRGAIAIGLDTRTRAFDPEAFERHLDALKSRDDLRVEVIFLESGDEMLRRRFTETRRPHPLAGGGGVMAGVTAERTLLAPLKERADHVFDTTDLTAHDLRRLLSGHFRIDQNRGMTISVVSFSSRLGLPREADLLFDVRFLANPYYVESLRPLSGHDTEVGAFIAHDPAYREFFDGVTKLVLSLLPHYQREGKAYLTLAFGCTGGRHRSVYLAEQVAAVLSDKGYAVTVSHRDTDIYANNALGSR
jgi:RNase adapter protein RapZ